MGPLDSHHGQEILHNLVLEDLLVRLLVEDHHILALSLLANLGNLVNPAQQDNMMEALFNLDGQANRVIVEGLYLLVNQDDQELKENLL